jgi:hypothetical protein
MKKVLLEEINRINELLGVKQKIDEQMSAFIRGLVPAMKDDFLDVARTIFTSKAIRQVDDLTETEILQVLKSSAAKMLRRNIYAEITNDLMMTAAKFKSKTSRELMQDLRTYGVKDPEFAGAYLKKFAKDNNVDTADKKFASIIGGGGSPTPPAKPINFNSSAPLQGTYSATDYIRAAELDPILGPILKKSGKAGDLEEWIKLNMAKGVVSQDELTRLVKDFIQKIPLPSGSLGRKWSKFINWVSSKEGIATIAFILLAGVYFGWWTAEDVVEGTKERIFNDEKNKPEEETSNDDDDSRKF